MLILKTFGGVSLSNGEAVLDGEAVQHRRLALLSVIACAGAHGVSRDKLVGLFWPESDAARARHALSQWLFLLRRDLPTADVVTGAAELRVDRGSLRCDAVDFDEAIVRRDYARAIDLYTGAFLDGFFLSEAPAFERWAEDERARRHADASRAVEEVARSAEARGDEADAVRWWRRLSGLEPLSGRVAAELMRALARAGERAVAIAHAREHARLVERTLGHPPGPEVADLARQLSASSTAAAPHAAIAPRVSRRESSYVTWLRGRLMPRVHIDRVIRDTPIMTLFAATDPETGHALVVRVLASAIVARADMRRLIDRLYIATRLTHPRLIPLGQLHRDEELVYLAGPPAPGESLRTRLERERHLSLSETLIIARDVASALTAAEDSGVPHLDLTPRRIMLDRGAAFVTDTGIMDAMTHADPESATVSDAIRGTAAYMSPEQLAGESAGDRRSDVYSLACVVYHALTGEVPHHAKSTRGVVAMRLTQPPQRVSLLRDGVPEALESLLAKALARVPAERFATMRELHEAIEAIPSAA